MDTIAVRLLMGRYEKKVPVFVKSADILLAARVFQLMTVSLSLGFRC